MNAHGFYTFTSQPGKITTDNHTERRQRAYVRGYMHKDMAAYIMSNLTHIPSLLIRYEGSLSNKALDSSVECTCGSVEFKDGRPCTMDFDIGDYSQSFNFNQPLHRPFITNIAKTCDDSHFINKAVFDVPLADLVEFDILDLQWNGDNRIWLPLLNCIIEWRKISTNI